MLSLLLTAAVTGATAGQVVWRTPGSITFASADGDGAWMIEAPVTGPGPARLVRIGPRGVTDVIPVPGGGGFSPVGDGDHVYLVAGRDVVRLEKRPPHRSRTLAAGEVWPIGVAVDAAHVYFTNQSTAGLVGGPREGKPGSVSRVPKAGGAVERLSSAPARELVLDAEAVYFSSGLGVRAVSRRGGPTRTLVDDLGGGPHIALDGRWLLYTRLGGVSRVNTADGRVEALLEGLDNPLFVAASVGVVYVGANIAFQGRDTPPRPAEILRLRPGGPPERLWSSLDRLTAMVLAGPNLYIAFERMGEIGGTTVHRIDVR